MAEVVAPRTGGSSLLPGLRFTRLKPHLAEVGTLIGEGSFGMVFSGTYKLQVSDAHPTPVAFKRIKAPGSMLTPAILKGFEREVQAMQV